MKLLLENWRKYVNENRPSRYSPEGIKGAMKRTLTKGPHTGGSPFKSVTKMLPGKDDRNDISAPPAMEEGEETDPRITTLEQFGIVPGAAIYDREFGGSPQALTIEVVDESGVEWSGGTFGGGKTTLEDALEAVNTEEWVPVEKYIKDSPLLPLTPPKSAHSKFLGIVETLLNEISFEDAKKSLFSKNTKKIIRNFNYNSGKDPDDMMDGHLSDLSNLILRIIPEDLEDKQKGLTLLWLLKLVKEARSYRRIIRKLRYGGTGDLNAARGNNIIGGDLEKFFHYQRFMDEKDLMKISSFDELYDITVAANEEIKKHQEEKEYQDVEAGTEVLRGKVEESPISGRLELRLDDGIGIIAIHNKGAACHWGRKTDWCTAADLDYFNQYYKPDDPLFYFVDKEWGESQGSDGRYQFHYGTGQFMDVDENHADPELIKDLTMALQKTKAFEQYPKFTSYAIKHITEDQPGDITWRVSKEELESVIDIMNMHWKVRLASSYEAKPEALDYLATTETEPILLDRIVGNKKTTNQTLERFVDYKENEEISLVARKELFYRAASSNDEQTVEKYAPLVDEVAKSYMLQRAPAEIAIKFVNDKSPKVRVGVAKNSRLPSKALRGLYENDPDKTVREEAKESLRKREAHPDAVNPEGEGWQPGMPTPMGEGTNKQMKYLLENWEGHTTRNQIKQKLRMAHKSNKILVAEGTFHTFTLTPHQGTFNTETEWNIDGPPHIKIPSHLRIESDIAAFLQTKGVTSTTITLIDDEQ